MNKNTKIFFWVLSCIVILWTIYWFATHFERVSETVVTGFQGKARYNPLLAAEYLLTRLGATVLTANTATDLKNKLKLQDLLILVQYNKLLKEEQSAQLLRWVTTGGHLIIVSNAVYDVENPTSNNNDPLLRALQVFRYENDLDEADLKSAPLTEITWTATPLQVAFQPNYRLESTRYEPIREISDNYGTHLLTYSIGNGIITVLSDFELLKNEALGNYDHAQFFWQLVNLERPVERVWLLQLRSQYDRQPLQSKTKDNTPSFWQVLWQNLWTILLSSAMLLLIWLWFASRRFGPLLPDPPPNRRRLLEHIAASGNFLWRHGKYRTLLHSTRQALLTRLNLVHPDWSQLPPLQLSQRLAQESNLSAKEIEMALTADQPFFTKNWQQRIYPESAFTRTISILSQLRKAL